METVKYQRILLKLSGEALGNTKGAGIDPERALAIAQRVKERARFGNGPRNSRLYGNGCNCNECVSLDGRT
jgi:hypothetical protein